MKKGQRQQLYKELVEKTAGLWKQGDGLAYQGKLRPEWEQRWGAEFIIDCLKYDIKNIGFKNLDERIKERNIKKLNIREIRNLANLLDV